MGYVLYNFPGIHARGPIKWVVNGWNIDDTLQMQDGLPFTAGVSGFPSNGILSDLNGAGGGSVMPQIGVNSYRYPRDIVDDARLQKNFAFAGGRSLELSADAYNAANHENITGFEANYLYYESGYSLEYTGVNGQGERNFKVPDAANNSGFLYTPREIEIVGRFNF